MVEKIVAAGPVIICKGKLLVSHDGKDEFFKIPGGKPKENESLEDCVLRELKEETGFSGKIGEKLSRMQLIKKPGTGEEVDIFLYHFKFELDTSPKEDNFFEHNGHKVYWLDINKIKKGEHEVAPNIKFLIKKGEIR